MPGRTAFLACLASLWALVAHRPAQPAERAEESLVFGMSTALSGPTAALGTAVRAGVQAAFDECNAAGGVRGRTLTLIALDDAYEPKRTGPNMRDLSENHRCLAVIGNVGTPTAVAALPVCRESGLTFFAPFTGASILRTSPPDPLVVNFRASYAEETAAMVESLLEHAKLKPEEIAFFTQRDAYGDAGYDGGVAALRKHGLTSESRIAHGRYERNTSNVENALADILSAPVPPRAVIMVGTAAPTAKFLRLARDIRLDAVFLSVSFVSATQLAADAGAAAEGVIVTEVVPHPNSSLDAAKRFREAIKRSQPAATPNHASFEGYLAGRTLILALERDASSPTRESVNTALLSLGAFDLGVGASLELSASRRQASHSVWPSVIRGGRVAEYDWAALSGDVLTPEKP